MTYPPTFTEPSIAPGNAGDGHPYYEAHGQPAPLRSRVTDRTSVNATMQFPQATTQFPYPSPFAPVATAVLPDAPISAPLGAPNPTIIKRRTSRASVATIVILSLLTVAALGLGGYFWFAADQWLAASTAWEDQARTHGNTVADLESQLAASQAEIATLQLHLESAQGRVTELANERAQLGDQQVVDQNRIDFQQRLSAAAANVASSLDLCISRQDELIEALRNPGRYTEESVARFGEQVVQFCNEARNANANLQAEINR